MLDLPKFFSYVMCGGFLFEVSFQMLFLSSLVAVVAWYMLRQPASKEKQLTKEQQDEVIARYEPESLVPEFVPDPLAPKKRIVTSKAGKFISLDGVPCLNLATHNYLGLVEDAEVEARASASINKYGVGSCGPRGFYGTVDVHLDLEEKLAEFMEVEEACVYSYGFATMASAIPAYCKKGDLVFVDEAANFSIQKGLDASRSHVHYFKHNDMVDLERLLKEQQKVDAKNPKKASRTRRFLIVEGIYLNTGSICKLPELIVLRKEYKLRMLIDESISFGTLGAHGKGVVEYFDVPNIEVDLRIGSMEGTLASIGGFCCGASFIVEHQRLSGVGYCFSASLPPMLAVAALTSLDHITKHPELFTKLQAVCTKLHKALDGISLVRVSGHLHSAVKHLHLKQELDYSSSRQIFNSIVDYCIDHNVAVIIPPYLETVEKFAPKASIRIVANVSLTDSDIEQACNVINDACNNFIPLKHL